MCNLFTKDKEIKLEDVKVAMNNGFIAIFNL